MSSLNNSSVLHKPNPIRWARDYNVQALQDALLGIDNKVDPLYILLPTSELGKYYRIRVCELLLAASRATARVRPYYTRISCITSNVV